MEHALGRHRPAAHSTACRLKVVLEAWVQAVHRADHLLVLGDGGGAEGDGGVGRRGQDVVAAHDLEQVHGAAAAALDVVAVHRPVADRGERLLERRRLADAVGVQGQLHVVALGDGEGGVDDLGVRARVLVHLEAACPPLERGLEEALVRGGGTGQRQEVERDGTPGVEQAIEVRPRIDAEVEGAAVAHRDERRGAPRERRGGDLRPEQVDVRVDRAGRRDEALGRDDARRRGQRNGDAVHRVGIPGASDRDDAAVLDTERRLAYAEDGIEQDDVRDGDVQGVLRPDAPGRHEPVADRLREADDRLGSRRRVVGLDLEQQVRVAQANTIAGGRAVERRVLRPRQVHTTGSSISAPGAILTVAPAGRSARAPARASRSSSRAELTRASGKCEPT